MNPTIGFTNKYYTLWEVSDPYQTFEGVYTVTRQDYTYIQNLSFELDKAQQKAIEKYGEKLPVDEELRGKSRSFSKSLSINVNPDKFLFGKYKGQNFVDVDDVSYKMWYWSATEGTEKESSVLQAELIKRGMFIEFQGEFLTLDDFEARLEDEYRKLNDALFPNGHYGTNGDRVTIKGEVLSVGSLNSYYGRMYLYRIAVEDVSYFVTGGRPFDLKEGDMVEVTGRIKWVKFWSDYHSTEVVRTELKRAKVTKL